MKAEANLIGVRRDPAEADAPRTIPRGAREVVTISCGGPFGLRSLECYRLSTNRRRSQWILWWWSEIGDTDGDVGFLRVAWCSRRGMTDSEAAALLLRSFWQHMRGVAPFPEELESGGLLDEDEVRTIIADVWHTDEME